MPAKAKQAPSKPAKATKPEAGKEAAGKPKTKPAAKRPKPPQTDTERASARRARILEEGGAQLALLICREAKEALEKLAAQRETTKTAVIEELLLEAMKPRKREARA